MGTEILCYYEIPENPGIERFYFIEMNPHSFQKEDIISINVSLFTVLYFS